MVTMVAVSESGVAEPAAGRAMLPCVCGVEATVVSPVGQF